MGTDKEFTSAIDKNITHIRYKLFIMKLYYTNIIGLTFAGMAKMQNDRDLLANNTLSGNLRVFSGSLADSIASMNELGCWCYFDEDIGRGRGAPFNSLDALCKTLANGYECAMRDAENNGETCTPWEVDYISAVG